MRRTRAEAVCDLLVGIVCLALTGSAATITHSRVVSDTDDAKDTGIRYYGASPYLIAYSDGKGGIVTEVQYMPDPAKMMSAMPSARLADVDSTMEFEHGVLKSSEDSADASALPKAVIEAIEKVAPSLIASAFNKTEEPSPTVPAPYVFKIVVHGSDVHFVGSHGDQRIKLTLLPQEKKER